MMRFSIGCLGLIVLAMPVMAARLDFVFAYDFSAAKPAKGEAITLTSTLQKEGAPLGETVMHPTVTYKGNDRQTFAVTLDIEGAETADAVVHTIAYSALGGTPITLTQRVLSVPFASRAKVAESGHGGSFALLKEGTKATSTALTVQKSLQGIDRELPDVTTEALILGGGLSIETPTTGTNENPSFVTAQLLSKGAIRLTGEGSDFPEGATKGLGIVPDGTIIAWTRSDPPGPGWVLCDGKNGTPDLQGLFPVAASDTNPGAYAPNKTGGAATVLLTTDMIPTHTHNVSVRVPRNRKYHFDSVSLKTGDKIWGRGSVNVTTKTSETANPTAHDNLPPYYVVQFYMRKGGAQ